MDKHNRHHAYPNQEGKDLDIEIAALAFTEGQVRSRGPVARFLYRYQAYLFFPLLLLEAINLHVSSIGDPERPAPRRPGWSGPAWPRHVRAGARP